MLPLQMNQFKILAHGTDFDVDAFLAGSSLSPTTVWHKGKCSRGHRDPTTSGFDIVLGDGETLDIYSQQNIAVNFIQKNLTDLKECADYPGMKHYMLFIQQRTEITLDVCGFCTELSRELLQLTIAAKMDAVTYVDLVRLDRQQSGWPTEPST
jgi:hypothetical protein